MRSWRSLIAGGSATCRWCVSPLPLCASLLVPFGLRYRIKFSEPDPYDHVGTGKYATYYVDHRMEGLRESVGWDLKTLEALPFMVWVRRMEIDFVRPLRGDQEITITSFVREFRGSDALIECSLVDADGVNVSRCLMTVAHVDKRTNRATDWPPELIAVFVETETT